MEKFDTIGSRFLASLIDSLLAIPVTILVMGFANIFDSPKINLALTISISAIPVFYTILMHNFYGQTLGKMAMKVKVLDISEKPITFTQAVIRSLPQLLPVFITASTLISAMKVSGDPDAEEFLGFAVTAAYVLYSIWGIADIIVCLSSEKKRALHDFIAGTVVVRTDGWSNL